MPRLVAGSTVLCLSCHQRMQAFHDSWTEDHWMQKLSMNMIGAADQSQLGCRDAGTAWAKLSKCCQPLAAAKQHTRLTIWHSIGKCMQHPDNSVPSSDLTWQQMWERALNTFQEMLMIGQEKPAGRNRRMHSPYRDRTWERYKRRER